MSELVSINIRSITEKICPVLETQEAVIGAYLFGSALDRCRPDSDIDVALLMAPSLSEKQSEDVLERVLDILSPVGNHRFDLIILNHCNAIFAYKIITQGQLIYASDPGVITDFMELTSRQRAENYPRYRQALDVICEGRGP